MRIGWVAALVLVVAAGCGSGDAGGSTDDESPLKPQKEKPLPKVEPGSKREAKELLDDALRRLASDGTISFHSRVTVLGTEVTLTGAVDLEHRVSQSETAFSGEQTNGLVDSFEYRVRGTHVYGSPTFGPFDKCWFDYGESSPLLGNDPAPWLHIAVAAVTDGEAVGMAQGTRTSVVVDVPAVELLAVTASKLVNVLADQLQEATATARAVVEITDGRYSALRFNASEAFRALEDSGIDLTDAITSAMRGQDLDASSEDVAGAIKSYFAATQVVTYEQGGPVSAKVPPADELMDASGITKENPKDPELCAAAR